MRRERRGRIEACMPVNGAGDDITPFAIRAAVAALRAAVMLPGMGLIVVAMPVAIVPGMAWRVSVVMLAMGAMLVCIHGHGCRRMARRRTAKAHRMSAWQRDVKRRGKDEKGEQKRFHRFQYRRKRPCWPEKVARL